MANKKISELPSATTPLDNADLFEVVQGGINKKVAKSDVSSGGGTVTSVSGTTNRITSTGGATPVIDIAAAYDATHLNGRPVVDTTGTAIAFALPQFYGSDASPETGNITLVTTGLVKGMVQVLYHNNGTEPTFGAEFVRVSGFYITSTLNIIYMHAISSSRIEYMIFQEL